MKAETLRNILIVTNVMSQWCGKTAVKITYFADKPRLNLTEGKKIDLKDVKEGNDVYFECLVDSNPAVSKIIWSHNVSSSPFC